jgi:hypothetical protein
MARIEMIHDKPLIEDIFEYDLIIVGTGIYNTLGNGFQYDIKINFPNVNKIIKETPYGDKRKLGTVTIVNDKPIFCLGFIHKGGFRKDLQTEYLDYNALTNVLSLIDENFENKKIATTLIGGSKFDGNGDKDKILGIFQQLSDKNMYYLYDYEQRDYRIVHNEMWREIMELKDKIPYQEFRQMKDNYIALRKHGIYGIKKQKLL